MNLVKHFIIEGRYDPNSFFCSKRISKEILPIIFSKANMDALNDQVDILSNGLNLILFLLMWDKENRTGCTGKKVISYFRENYLTKIEEKSDSILSDLQRDREEDIEEQLEKASSFSSTHGLPKLTEKDLLASIEAKKNHANMLKFIISQIYEKIGE